MSVGTPFGMTGSGRRHSGATNSAAVGDTAIAASRWGNISRASAARAARLAAGSASAYMWNVATWAAAGENPSA